MDSVKKEKQSTCYPHLEIEYLESE